MTLRELTILQFIDQVTDKPDWTTKVFSEEITSKWKTELETSQIDMSEAMFNWSIAELRWRAKRFETSPTGAISVYSADVVKSDIAISRETKEALKRAVRLLEDVPANRKDWHPGSNEQVLDLVHPSLFPLAYRRSKVLPIGSNKTTLEDSIKRCGEGETVPAPTYLRSPNSRGRSQYNPWSNEYQWLPCEVDISGEKAKFTSFINNLHPTKHLELYGVIEEALTGVIPLWEKALAPWAGGKYPDWFHRIEYGECQYDPDPEYGPDTDGPQRLPGESEGDHWKRRRRWYIDTRRVVLPEPACSFEESKLSNIEKRELNLKELYGDRGIQVIVKLANIHLTPEKPEYPGGSWHVEGKLNEHICATAIFYYSSENIGKSTLAFRQQVDDEVVNEISYEQDHHDWLPAVFGLENEGPGVQDIGSIETKEGRVIAFPNVLQHQVQPFKLADQTKPGHRKILAFFLVDPTARIISTANVPCQRLDWWREATIKEMSGAAGFNKLPLELQDQVFGGVDGFPISLEDAMAMRLELMEERKSFISAHTVAFTENEISLCEH
ncbi:hypothetical protein FA15DRAFT_615143 [Coprinopsis marcescibilis]|uniref:Uncharacterized protein n=1 Tax=Coprinopsis marcescibilis TaxID=230819 RepID=A0A5C3L1G5_COPMA|nr:hypothetical protein FA15DRAFT_615143 [Coprinopsis marcescibilis]